MDRTDAIAGARRDVEAPRRPLAVLLAVLLVAATLAAGPPRAVSAAEPAGAVAALVDAEGQPVGEVVFADAPGLGMGGGTLVSAWVEGLPRAGFHGFHVHAVGACAPDFGAAGGHFDPTGHAHGAHAGDLPPLLADADGNATATFITDRFSVADLLTSADGAAVIVHQEPDNLAHIPERYVSTGEDLPSGYDGGPDGPTLATGDAGARIACGVVEPGAPDHHQVLEVPPPPARTAVADLLGVDGTVLFGEQPDGSVVVSARVEGLPRAGFHGFHVHAVGACAPDFGAAGGHFDPTGHAHGAHAGDLPPLLADADGNATATFVTDRFSVADLLTSADGAAVIVHQEPDNLAHIPERYVSTGEDLPSGYDGGPDGPTLATGDAGARIACGVVEPRTSVARVSGPDRIATAVEVSLALHPEDGSAATVLLSRSDDFADALAATPLAVALDGPTLVTPTSRLDARTRAELDRVLDPGATVHVLGGSAAVGDAVVDELEDAGYEVQRIAGADRYATAVAIAGRLGDPEAVLIARGTLFADALAAGAAAAAMGGAVLLTTDDAPHPTTRAYLDRLARDEVYAVGGPAARAHPEATPISGTDRHDTARVVAETLLDEPAVVGMARSDAFPDGLTGGVLTARHGGLLLVTPPGALAEPTAAAMCAHAGLVTHAVGFGGGAALADDVLGAVADLLAGRGCPDR